jgi:Fic family protein
VQPFADLLKQIDVAKAQLDALRPLDREQEDRVMQKFRLWWTYHSNAIEGNVLTQGETEMFLLEGLTAKGKPLKDHLDLRGHSNAINYLLAFIREREVLTEAAIRKLHEVLLVEPYRVQAVTPDGQPTTKAVALGEYKSQPNHVRTPTGEIHYYASPAETPAKMQELMDWYRDETTKHTAPSVEIAARYHHRFTAIHPFDDGNGRMSRLLMNLMLMQEGYPPVVIRLSERDQYLAALRRADAGEVDDFLTFIAEHVLSSLDLYLRAAKGEEIHEPTDLEKEIALLKLELKHVEEPEALTQQVQMNLFESSLDPLFAGIARSMNPLFELFAENRLTVRGQSRDTFNKTRQPLQGEHELAVCDSLLRPTGCWAGGNLIEHLEVDIDLIGFKKGRFEIFDRRLQLRLSFERLKYQVIIHTSASPHIIQHFYQEPLTKDEINDVAQRITRYFLDAIRKKTNGGQ